jgi:hypothetical protein
MSENSSVLINALQRRELRSDITPTRPQLRPHLSILSSVSSISTTATDNFSDDEESVYATPLTPTSTAANQAYGKGVEPAWAESPTLRKSNRVLQGRVQDPGASNSHTASPSKEIKAEDDDFVPEKLIRGFTNEMQRSQSATDYSLKDKVANFVTVNREIYDENRRKILQDYFQPTEKDFKKFNFSNMPSVRDRVRDGSDKDSETHESKPAGETRDEGKSNTEKMPTPKRHPDNSRGPNYPDSGKTKIKMAYTRVKDEVGEIHCLQTSAAKVEHSTEIGTRKSLVQESVTCQVLTAMTSTELLKILGKIMPLDILLKLSTSNENHDCVATLTKWPGPRCDKKAIGAHKYAEEKLEKLQSYKNNNDYSGFLGYIEGIVDSVFCKRHRNLAYNKLKVVRTHLNIPEKANTKFDVGTAVPVHIAALNVWIDVISKPTTKSTEAELVTIKEDLASEVVIAAKKVQTVISITEVVEEKAEEDLDEISFLPAEMEATHMKSEIKGQHKTSITHFGAFVAYKPQSTLGIPVNVSLLQTIERPLLKSELHDGYIYMFWVKPVFGYVKIGMTEKQTNERLEEWKEKCGKTFELFPKFSASNVTRVKHVARVEKLIHAELKERRARIGECDVCGKGHIEWFYVNDTEAKRVYDKWSSWTQDSPYQECTQTGKWRLRSDITVSALMDLCQPIISNEQRPTSTKARSNRDRHSRGSAPRKSM